MARVFSGTVVKNIGDAYLMTFTSPTDSLLCALAVQDLLADRNLQLPPTERFEVRFAINIGEVRVYRKDVFGEAVNIAARIEGLAKGGEVYFSEAVYLMMNKSEVPYESAGRHKLKGIQEPVGVYRVPRLSEVGAYKLHPVEDSAAADTVVQVKALPFGGLALKKVHSHMTGSAVGSDGTFSVGGALSELHYSAATKALLFGASTWWRKALAPLVYVGAGLWAALGLLLSLATYRGLWASAQKTSMAVQVNRSYRKKLMGRVALLGLVAAASFLIWRQYVVVQEAKAYKALAEQRDAAQQRALNKEKRKFHLPW